MDKKFSKLEEKSKIDLSLVNLETVEQQLKSMKLAYISSSFILKGMEQDFDNWYEKNIEDTNYSDESLKKAEDLALKQLDDPNFYQGEAMKQTPPDIAQFFQALLMLKQRKDEVNAKRDELGVVARNITWLRELLNELGDDNAEAPEDKNTALK